MCKHDFNMIVFAGGAHSHVGKEVPEQPARGDNTPRSQRKIGTGAEEQGGASTPDAREDKGEFIAAKRNLN